MQYSLYAFIPFGILVAIALIAAGIALWPGKRRRVLSLTTLLADKPRSSAEILNFPSRLDRLPIARAERLRRGNS
jgi:hypothetical protein